MPASKKERSAENLALITGSPLFDTAWYRDHYDDVSSSGLEPLIHFLKSGLGQWRRPGPDFEPVWYARQYPDVHGSGIPPFLHFLKIGEERGRFPNSNAFAAAERKQRMEHFIEHDRELALPAAADPLVSVVIVTYNSPNLVFGCLSALAEHLRVPAEVIVFDNASGAETRALLKRAEGARIVLNDTNLHFLRGVNAAAAIARGRYLLILNSDAEIHAGSVEAAVETIEAVPRAGAVGARLMLASGNMQEAGCIVWRDGSVQNYGRGSLVGPPEYEFRREVDYCSAAFLLLRRDVFAQLGGFDERYAPAYYEDVDLCFALKNAGYRTIYDPAVVVSHFEFGSATGGGTAAELMRRNREIFQAKWAAVLSSRLPPAEGNVLLARSPTQRRNRLLVVADRAPDDGTGWVVGMLGTLAAIGIQLGFLPVDFADGAGEGRPRDQPRSRAILPVDVERLGGVAKDGIASFLSARAGFYGKIVAAGARVFRQIARLREQESSRLEGVEIIYAAGAPQAKDGDALPGDHGAALMEAEASLALRADTVIVASDREAVAYRDAGCRDVRVVGYAARAALTPERLSERRDLLFVGRLTEDARAEVAGIIWFVSEVLPRIHMTVTPPPRLVLAGDIDLPSIERIDRLDIVRADDGEQSDRWFSQCRVIIAPSRVAAGLPLSVCEAAAAGIPAVTTSPLRSRLGWENERELLVGDSAEEFATACVRLFEDDRLWSSLRRNARKAVERDYDPAKLRAEVEAAFGP